MAGKLAKVAATMPQNSDEILIWPENLEAVGFFIRIGTRWAHGFNGPVGLRYEAIYPLMDRMNLAPEKWDSLLADIEVMEHAALEAMHSKA